VKRLYLYLLLRCIESRCILYLLPDTPLAVYMESKISSVFSEATIQTEIDYTIKINQKKHTTVGIRWWSPTQLLIHRSQAYVWQSGRDAQFSLRSGRTLSKPPTKVISRCQASGSAFPLFEQCCFYSRPAYISPVFWFLETAFTYSRSSCSRLPATPASRRNVVVL
jgi:hypothetical protein